MYKDEELRPFLVDMHKQTLIDLQYFVEKLKVNGHKVLILMDASQAEGKTYQPQTHNIKLVTKKGFHVDGSIDELQLDKRSQANARRRRTQHPCTWFCPD
jgi:hypothetical protein